MMRPVAVLAFLAWGAVWAQTFQVKNDAWPWHDRVDQWQLVDVPDQLVSDEAVPQQSCGSRGLVFPPGLKAAVVAMTNLNATLVARNKKLLPSHLREFRSLQTTAARRAVLPALGPGAAIENLEDAIHHAIADQWVDFVWTTENKELDPTVGVFALLYSRSLLCFPTERMSYIIHLMRFF